MIYKLRSYRPAGISYPFRLKILLVGPHSPMLIYTKIFYVIFLSFFYSFLHHFQMKLSKSFANNQIKASIYIGAIFCSILLYFSFVSPAFISLTHSPSSLSFQKTNTLPLTAFIHSTSYNDSLTNSTLNFGQLVYINVPQRYDRDDFMVLQSSVTGIKPMRFIGVEAATLDDKGLPPSEQHHRTSAGAAACFRSHADVWRRFCCKVFVV